MTAPAPRRASPLPPDERRAALIAATLPLVRAHGVQVSTRQIARAAGVAEGTIFRVFPSKDELVGTAVQHAFDPSPVACELAGIDRSAPLRERLIQAVEIIQRRLTGIFHLLDALGMSRPPEDQHGAGEHSAAHTVVLHTLAGVLEPDRDQLRCEPLEAARLLRLVTFAGSHPGICDGATLSPEEIASLLLDGIRRPDIQPVRRPARPRSAGARLC